MCSLVFDSSNSWALSSKRLHPDAICSQTVFRVHRSVVVGNSRQCTVLHTFFFQQEGCITPPTGSIFFVKCSKSLLVVATENAPWLSLSLFPLQPGCRQPQAHSGTRESTSCHPYSRVLHGDLSPALPCEQEKRREAAGPGNRLAKKNSSQVERERLKCKPWDRR